MTNDLDEIEARANAATHYTTSSEHAHAVMASQSDVPALVAEVRALRAYNERLRGLVLSHESVSTIDHDSYCPWCEKKSDESAREHFKDCAAFSAPGVLR